MFEHVLAATLPRPEALNDDSWSAITHYVNELKEACKADRPMAVVGAAKELVECIARVVLESRGQLQQNVKYEVALSTAFDELKKPGGSDLSDDPLVRNVASSAKKIASQLDDLRNTYGSGHGRATLPAVIAEVAETSVDAALLWSRWALRRLHHYIVGDVQSLVRDLHHGLWSTGELTSRLTACGLSHLSDEDQRAVGLAVGQRGSSNTFNVWFEGVDVCINSSSLDDWPAAYREGLAEGLLIDRYGEIRLDDNARSPGSALAALIPHPEFAAVLSDLADKLDVARWSRWNRATSDKAYQDCHEAAQRLINEAPSESAAGEWARITVRFRTLANAERSAADQDAMTRMALRGAS